jgi:hypothetical protein
MVKGERRKEREGLLTAKGWITAHFIAQSGPQVLLVMAPLLGSHADIRLADPGDCNNQARCRNIH